MQSMLKLFERKIVIQKFCKTSGKLCLLPLGEAANLSLNFLINFITHFGALNSNPEAEQAIRRRRQQHRWKG